jgi:anti-sigma-K factor RskA
MPERSGRPCETVAELAPEVALGVADALERAAVLAHVEECPACRTDLAGLVGMADALAVLAPAAEPPPGFESRVLDQLGEAPAARRRRRSATARVPGTPPMRRRLAVAGAVAAAMAVLAVGIAGLVAGGGGGGGGNPAVAAAYLTSGGRQVGQVVVTGGDRPLMWVSDGSLSGTVRCDVVTASGRVVTVGSYTAYGTSRSWTVPLPAGTQVRGAQLVEDGRVVASAVLPSPA